MNNRGNLMIKFKYIVLWTILILFDLGVYVVFGLFLMKYDDFYDESKGEYWSLASMTFSEKVPYIGINIWNFINLIAIGYLVYRWIKIKKEVT